MRFVYVLLCTVLLGERVGCSGSLLSRSLLKSFDKRPQRKLLNDKQEAFMKSVTGQFFVYMGLQMGIDKGDKVARDVLYEEKETELKAGLFKYVNVLDGVNFKEGECSFKFGAKKEDMVPASDGCDVSGLNIKDLDQTTPLEYLTTKISEGGDEFKENKVVFLIGKGEGDDMEVLMAVEIQAFKAIKKEAPEPVVEEPPKVQNEVDRKLKGEEEEGELIIKIMNSVAESRLKVQYAEQTVPSTNTFLNNVVTAFMLKNDQLVFDLEDLRNDLVKMMAYNFTNDDVGEDFDATKYELKADSNIEDSIKNENLKSPGDISRLTVDPLKFHLHYLQLSGDAEANSNYFHHHKGLGKNAMGKHPEKEELESADEQLLFLLTPNFMFIPPISVIVTRKGTTIKIIFHSAYFESTEYFSFAARPFITKIVEKRVKRMAGKVLRPIAILEHQSQDEEFNPDKANHSSAYMFLNTLNKSLDHFMGEEFTQEIKEKEINETAQTLVLVAETMEECVVEDDTPDRIMCVTVNEKNLPNDNVNMLEIHHKVFKPEPITFMKRYPVNSLYDMSLFTKSYARYLADVVASITSVGEMVDSPALYKHSFPPFEPAMSGVETQYIENDIFFLNESKAEPLSEPATLKMQLIENADANKVKTIGYKYVVPAEGPSRFNNFLTGAGGGE